MSTKSKIILWKAEIVLYCDGSHSQTNQLGGFAVVDESSLKTGTAIISGRIDFTTSQRAELIAVLSALTYAIEKEKKVLIITDSQYAANSINVWASNWKTNGWKDAKKRPIKNKDLIQELVKLFDANPKIKIESRNRNSDEIHELADTLANAARLTDDPES